MDNRKMVRISKKNRHDVTYDDFTSPENADTIWVSDKFKIYLGPNRYALYIPELLSCTNTKEVYFNSEFRLHRDDDLPAVVYLDGSMVWAQNGEMHREGDLPAWVELGDAGMNYCWYKNGEFHRDGDKPAVIETVIFEGEKVQCSFWYKDGKKHRDDGEPAEVCSNGELCWYKDGKKHRDDNDQPAEIFSDGEQRWYKDGKLHRGNGFPAIIKPNGKEEWYEDGKKIEKNENCLSESFFKPAKSNK